MKRGQIVIDDEATGYPDFEQVARKIESGHTDCSLSACCFRMVASAIRSQIPSPKPDEPTGLGAVVEEADGTRWIRTEAFGQDAEFNKPWQSGPSHRHWQIVDAVRVLSEGVPSC